MNETHPAYISVRLSVQGRVAEVTVSLDKPDSESHRSAALSAAWDGARFTMDELQMEVL